MRDSIFVKGFADTNESERRIEPLEIGLRIDMDRRNGKAPARFRQRLGNHRSAMAAAARMLCDRDPANRGYWIFAAGRKQPRNGDQFTPLAPAEPMDGLGVQSIRIGKGAVLLDNEDRLAQPQDVVEITRREFGKCPPFHIQVHDWFQLRASIKSRRICNHVSKMHETMHQNMGVHKWSEAKGRRTQ
jgi:hypothetical protein